MKKTLIVVDMQKDFIDGALGTKEAVDIVQNVKNKIAEYKYRGDEIIFTRDTHKQNYLETNEGRHLPVEHCIEGTEGWEIPEELYVEGATYINKVSNALIIKAAFPEIDVTVDARCCAGVTPETHASALTTMRCCQVNVIGE